MATIDGYKPVAKTVTNVTSSRQEINFTLDKDDIELKEVAVISKKPLIERKVDRVVFNVENSITAAGGDALEAVGKAPGVHVSNTGDISLAGKSTVSVMINDKMMQLDGAELTEMLRSMPSSDVARVEVITVPPAKYDAAGNSGIINIVTKKNRKNGLNGSVGLDVARNTYTSARPSGAFNYRRDKLNVFGTTDFGDNFSHPIETHTALYPGQTWSQVNSIENLHNFYYNTLGADYDITPKSVIGFLYTYAGSTPKMNEDIHGNWFNAGNGLDSTIATKAHTSDFGERNVINLNYVRKIDTSGKKLSADADFFTRTGRTERGFTTTHYLPDGTETGIVNTDRSTGRQRLYIGSIKTDIEWPVKFAKLSYGGKASFIHVLSDNVFEYLSSGNYIIDPDKTNKFDYKEYTEALYFSAQRKLNKHWDAQVGLRGEYTQTAANSLTLSTVHETKYFRLFPTGYLQYAINDDNILNLSYNKRIDRPNMVQINPFRRYATPTSYSEGNPFLQPSFTSNLELSYTLASKYTFTAYAQQVKQSITQILEIDTLNKGYYWRYGNIGNAGNYGVSASADLSPAKWWETDIQVYGFHTQVAANYYNTASYTHYDMNGFTVENDHSFTLNKDKTLLAECGFEYVSFMIENYNYHFPNWNLNAGLKGIFLKRNLTIALNVNDIFRTDITRIRNLYNNSFTNNYYDNRGARLNINYKFGNKNIKARRQRNSTLEESRRT